MVGALNRLCLCRHWARRGLAMDHQATIWWGKHAMVVGLAQWRLGLHCWRSDRIGQTYFTNRQLEQALSCWLLALADQIGQRRSALCGNGHGRW